MKTAAKNVIHTGTTMARTVLGLLPPELLSCSPLIPGVVVDCTSSDVVVFITGSEVSGMSDEDTSGRGVVMSGGVVTSVCVDTLVVAAKEVSMLDAEEVGSFPVGVVFLTDVGNFDLVSICVVDDVGVVFGDVIGGVDVIVDGDVVVGEVVGDVVGDVGGVGGIVDGDDVVVGVDVVGDIVGDVVTNAVDDFMVVLPVFISVVGGATVMSGWLSKTHTQIFLN
jgi:hypothetical protein